MLEQKLTGSYYTPKILSDFLMEHIFTKYLKTKTPIILEPSCGDGQFVESFFNAIDLDSFTGISIDLFDINSNELTKALVKIPQNGKIVVNAICDDYLNFSLENPKKYDLIFGNPPYIRNKNMETQQIKSCEEVHKQAALFSNIIRSKNNVNNIWTAFVESAILNVNDNGIICLVIPSEVLQVKYAEEIRQLIADQFSRVEIFAFNELIFSGIQQDVIAIICVKSVEREQEQGFSFYQVNSLVDLKEPKFTEKYNNIHRTTLNKWTNYILTDHELDFIDSLKNRYNNITEYCDRISAGIVTAANEFFIISQSQLNASQLELFSEFIKPMLPKGSVVQDLIDYKEEDYQRLLHQNKRVNFLLFPDQPIEALPTVAKTYVIAGEQKKKKNGELDQRFKMKKRKNWHHVPNTWTSEGLFIKRCDQYPKLILNTANSCATDSFYRIISKSEYEIKNIVFSFYNSLTFILAELEGRFYGGGVLELTPNEFKSLIIPYQDNISDEQFSKLDQMFRDQMDINIILNFTDGILLPELTGEELERLRSLRSKLLDRRLKSFEMVPDDLSPIASEAM